MKLVSEFENEVVITNDEIKILRLKEMGFKEVKTAKEIKPIKEVKPTKKGKQNNGNKEKAD